jgi:hypothetical protein
VSVGLRDHHSSMTLIVTVPKGSLTLRSRFVTLTKTEDTLKAVGIEIRKEHLDCFYFKPGEDIYRRMDRLKIEFQKCQSPTDVLAVLDSLLNRR